MEENNADVKKEIRDDFKKIKNKYDLLSLLNKAKKHIYGENAFPIEIRQIHYYSSPKLSKSRYKPFSIKKKNGGERIIFAPVEGLKVIQKCLNLIFKAIYKPHKKATGFIPKRSIVDNAKFHEGMHYVYNIDLKDFFPSIDQARVWGRLQHPPFNLNKETGRLELANIIASLCCYEMEVERLDSEGKWVKKIKNVLPQGAPTSPMLSNIICQQLDFSLNAAAKRFDLKYSRYADDITFSSKHNVYQKDSEFLKEIYRIITKQNFYIQENKTRLQKSDYRQKVTGLVVNEKINTQKRYIKQLRLWLHKLEKLGEKKAQDFFRKHYLKDKGHVKKGQPNMTNVIYGKLCYLKMVKGEENPTYAKLDERFKNLTGKKPKDIHKPKELIKLLDNFTSGDSILKYATHSWDNGGVEGKFKDFNEFLKKLDSSKIKKITRSIKDLHEKFGNKIYAFLYGKNEGGSYIDSEGNTQQYKWGQHRIPYGWRSKELNDWVTKNPDKNVFDWPLPKPVKIENKEIKKFQDVVDFFKKEIEIREEENQLEKLFDDLKKKQLNEFKVTYKNLEKRSFYTDYQWLYKSLEKIFDAIIKRENYKEILITAEDDVIDFKYTEVTILHKSSTTGKASDEFIEKIKKKDGDFGEIYQNLKNLCDWSVESDFKDGLYRIDILLSDGECFTKVPISNNPEGFKHILKFYKT